MSVVGSRNLHFLTSTSNSDAFIWWADPILVNTDIEENMPKNESKDWKQVDSTVKLWIPHDASWSLLFVGQQPAHHLLGSDLVNSSLLPHFKGMPHYFAPKSGISRLKPSQPNAASNPDSQIQEHYYFTQTKRQRQVPFSAKQHNINVSKSLS